MIGVVFDYLLGLQAQRYGANIFVVDGVGLAVCRELSPLLVAVIVAGRSGAANRSAHWSRATIVAGSRRLP